MASGQGDTGAAKSPSAGCFGKRCWSRFPLEGRFADDSLKLEVGDIIDGRVDSSFSVEGAVAVAFKRGGPRSDADKRWRKRQG